MPAASLLNRALPASPGLRLTLLAAALLQVSVAQADEAPPAELPKVTATATAIPGDTESRPSYTAGAIGIGKAPASVRATPHAVTVVTRQRLDDQNLTTVPDAVKQATGITVQRFDGAGLFNNYFARGYQLDNILLDGLTVPNSGNVTELDTAVYDSVEILRGPAGLYQGAGEPGAALNLVRKRAKAKPGLQGGVLVGSWNTQRADLDVTGKLVESGRVRGRVVGVYDERESYQDVINSQKKVIYGTVEFDLTDSTTLSAGVTRQDVESVIDQGLPAFAGNGGQLLDVDRSTFIGAKWNQLDTDYSDVFLDLEHLFENGGSARLAARYVEREMLYVAARANSAVNPATGNTALQQVLYTPDREIDTVDAYVNLPFALAGRKHSVLLGADWRQQDEIAIAGYGVAGSMNVYNPNHDIPKPAFNQTPSDTATTEEQKGVYTRVNLSVAEGVNVALGGRLTSWENRSTNRLNSTTSGYEQKNEFTPYGSVTVDLSDAFTAYVSYADVFKPQNSKGPDGNQIDPRVGRQYEIGLKGEHQGGRLNSQLALFRIDDENRVLALDGCSGVNCNVAGGKARSEGIEGELAGQLLPGWEIATGYTYNKTEQITAAKASQGLPVSTFAPEHTFKLWTTYRVQSGELKNLSLGAGVRAVSAFYAQSGAVKLEQDAYTVLQLQLGYQFTDKISSSLTFNNLLDSVYYEKVSGTGRQNFYGEPFNVMFGLRAKY